MKKLFYGLLVVMMMAVTSVVFSSCSSDDTTTEEITETLSGTIWMEEMDANGNMITVIFTTSSSGTFVAVNKKNEIREEASFTCTQKFKDGILTGIFTLSYDEQDYDKEYIPFTITGTKMTIYFDDGSRRVLNKLY